jgi:hypothetical protein
MIVPPTPTNTPIKIELVLLLLELVPLIKLEDIMFKPDVPAWIEADMEDCTLPASSLLPTMRVNVTFIEPQTILFVISTPLSLRFTWSIN